MTKNISTDDAEFLKIIEQNSKSAHHASSMKENLPSSGNHSSTNAIPRNANREDRIAEARRLLPGRIGLNDYIKEMRHNTNACRTNLVNSIKRGFQLGIGLGFIVGGSIGYRAHDVPGSTLARISRACVVSIPAGVMSFTAIGFFIGLSNCLIQPMIDAKERVEKK